MGQGGGWEWEVGGGAAGMAREAKVVIKAVIVGGGVVVVVVAWAGWVTVVEAVGALLVLGLCFAAWPGIVVG